MRKILSLVCLLASTALASAANLALPTKAPPPGYSPDTGGFYVGIGSFLETSTAQFNVLGTNVNLQQNAGSIGGVFGYGRGNGNYWYAVEGSAYWQNLGTSGSLCAAVCSTSNFSSTVVFELGAPAGFFSALPQINSLFPGFNPGAAGANMYPYIGIEVQFNDISASLGAMNARDWQIPFGGRAGVKTKLTNGSVMDVWADATFKASGFAVGPLATVNQGTTYRAGVSFDFGL